MGVGMWLVLVWCSLSLIHASPPRLFFPLGSIHLTVPLHSPPLTLLTLPALPFTPLSPSTPSFNPTFNPTHNLTYSFTGSDYLATLNSTPSISFTDVVSSEPGILQDLDESGWLEVQDDNGGYNRTQIRVQVVDKKCGEMVDELCFWKEGVYTVPENYPPVKVGDMGARYLKGVCEGYDVTYVLLNHTSTFAIISDGLYTRLPLDRDLDRWSSSSPGESRSYRNLEVVCSVLSPSGDTTKISRSIRINLLDVDDHPPRLQDKKDVVTIVGRTADEINDQLEKVPQIIFVDPDTSEVNHYSLELFGDDRHFFSFEHAQYVVDRDLEHHTAVNFKLFAKPGTRIPDEGYEVRLVVNDTSMLGSEDCTANLTFRFLPQELVTTRPIAENLSRNILYPPSVELLRTAAMLARVTQPQKNVTQCRFQLGGNVDVFNVTVKEGIVFVNRVSLLRKLQSTFQLEIKWYNKTTNETFSDFVTINLVNESNSICTNYSDDPNNWGHCASQGSKKACENTCGLGAGSHSGFINRGHTRCIWRPGTNMYSNVRTKYYATCRAEQDTCPNRVCDELEKAHHWLCPQDCAKVKFPLMPNPSTNIGLFFGVGICKCDKIESCYCYVPKPPITTTTTTIVASSSTMDYNEILLPANTSNVSRIVDPISAPSSPFPPSCGGSCVLAIGGGLLFLLAAASVLAACWRRRRVQDAARRDRKLAASAVAQHTYTPDSAADNGVGSGQLLLSFDMERGVYAAPKILPVVDSKWEFPREKLRIEQTLGEGEFGRVLRAKALEISNMPGYTTVAVKTLKEGARDSELADLMSEYQLLKEVSHPNVIRLLGACTLPGGPVYLVIEFAELGSLRNYLRRSRHLESDGCIPNSAALMMGENEPTSLPACKINPRDILSFAWQISKGMNYLNDMKLVHRDLAARNVLLSADMVCKISDFGLTRDVYEDDTYLKRTKGRVPVKWMAPESLADHIYNSKSDVWSFGILLWELVTLGASPYPGVAVQNLFHHLRSGYRMEKPENCSAILYKIMRVCWCEDPNDRPSFRSLMMKFETMLADGVDYLDLNPRTVHNRTYFTSLSDALIATPDDESTGYGNLTLMQPDTVNFLSPEKSKHAEVDKLQVLWKRPESPTRSYENQEAAQELHHYESPIKRHQTDRLRTPTNERPQSYIDMAGATENQVLLRSKSKEQVEQVSEAL